MLFEASTKTRYVLQHFLNFHAYCIWPQTSGEAADEADEATALIIALPGDGTLRLAHPLAWSIQHDWPALYEDRNWSRSRSFLKDWSEIDRPWKKWDRNSTNLYWVFSLIVCLSVTVKWLAVKTAPEMTSGGALNSAQSNVHSYISTDTYEQFLQLY